MNAAILDTIRTVAAQIGDVTSASAMSGRCMDAAYALTRALDGLVYEDEWECEVRVSAYPVQMWDAPSAIAADPMAAGHYVCRVEADGDVWHVDLTAAQFAALGHTGPTIAEGRRVDWSDYEPMSL